jgi:hypothetical protein
LDLDAHGQDDLPLKEEIQIIARNWNNFVAMVDDFQVPWDPGCGFDAYGPDKGLSCEHLRPLIQDLSLSGYFPRIPVPEETGSRRGYAPLAPHALSAPFEAPELLGTYPETSP